MPERGSPDMPNDEEVTSLGRRVKRYAKVSRSVGGLAAKVASNKVFGTTLNHDDHAARLTQALGGLKGPLMKVAQILSTIPDALPKEYAKELAALQADAPSMGRMFVKRRMKSELGPDWQSHFAEFEQTACAAASLGQVHRAVLADGRKVACKLQYPDMASAVEADLNQLKLIFSLYQRYDNSVETDNVHAELSERLHEELDYRREARHMRLYGHMLRDEPTVHVPEPVEAASSGRLLTMTWLQGAGLADFAGAANAQEDRNHVALNMFRAWYVPFYHYGVLHGDPHLGNYQLRDDLGVNLLDFGCIRAFRPSFVKGVIDLYHALKDKDDDRAAEAYRIWGFEDLSREKMDVLNIWANFVYGPLMHDKVRAMDETNSATYGAEVARKVRAELKRIGGVCPPREFVLLDRSAIGLGSVFLRLNAKLNWYKVYHEMVEEFRMEALAARQADAFKIAGLDPVY